MVRSPSGQQHFSLHYVRPSHPLYIQFSASASSIANLDFFIIFVITYISGLSVIITFNTNILMMITIIIIIVTTISKS
jgi:hypothetical protein